MSCLKQSTRLGAGSLTLILSLMGGVVGCSDDPAEEGEGTADASADEGDGDGDGDEGDGDGGDGEGDTETGEEGDSEDEGDSGSGDDDGFTPCVEDEANRPGPRMLRRLTSAEFESTMREVFQLSSADWQGGTMPPDPAAANGFTNNAAMLEATESYVEQLHTTAFKIATKVTEPERLAELLPCSAGAADKACAQTYLDTVGRRLFRRDLTAAESQRYLELWDTALEDGGFSGWVKWATTALIQSPHSINRSELGTKGDGDTYELTGYELATAMAYGFTGQAPSVELLDLAKAGELSDPKRRLEIAHDMIFSGGEVNEAYQQVFLNFARQYLDLPTLANLVKDHDKFGDFTEEVRLAMIQEVELTLSDVVFERQAGAQSLLGGRDTFVNGLLSEYYGFGDVSGDGFKRVERPEVYGQGLTGFGGMMALTSMADSTSPTQRGRFVRLKLFCDTLVRPEEVPQLPDPVPSETTRERYENHVTEDECAGCHIKMDPIGFAFEHLDAGGRYRMLENGLEIDATADVIATSEGTVAVDGAAEMSKLISDLPESSYCLAAYIASFSFGVDHKTAECLVNEQAEEFATQDASVLDYHLSLVTSEHFGRRVDE